MRSRSLALGVLVGLVATACVAGPKAVPTQGHPTVSRPSPSPSRSAVPSDGWIHLSSPQLHLTLEFPPIQGKVTYAYNRCAGAPRSCEPGSFYVWEIATKAENGDPWRYMFVGSTAQENAGRSWWPTDIGRWGHDAKGYWIYITEKVYVDAVTVSATRYGSALIFKPRGLFCDGCPNNSPDGGDRVAVVNLSEPHDGFAALSLYFAKRESLSTIKRALASIRFS
jgi:hypothetical protein